jgi:hypothetical protein
LVRIGDLFRVRPFCALPSGNFREVYDFFLFGIYARPIAPTSFER